MAGDDPTTYGSYVDKPICLGGKRTKKAIEKPPKHGFKAFYATRSIKFAEYIDKKDAEIAEKEESIIKSTKDEGENEK